MSLRDKLARAETALANLRVRYHQLLEELHLVERRLFVAKAERLDDVADAQLAFDQLLAETQAIEKALEAAGGIGASAEQKPKTEGDGPPKEKRRQPTTTPSGRRKLDESGLPEVPAEITDPELEGKAERIGVETSSRVGYERGGYRRLVLQRIIYKERTPSEVSTSDAPRDTANATCQSASGVTTATSCERGFRIVHAPMPREIMRRGMLAPSMIAYLLAMKYVLGDPFNRCEQKRAREGFPLDRGTMCRYAEHVGATLGCIVEAARTEAIATAFCLSTDATGIAIQPTPLQEGNRQPCRKGHFFVTLADKDHVFFDFQAKHTSLTVWNMFKGFSRYVQADAHAIYDALFKGIPPEGAEEQPGECGPPPTEGGGRVLSHARRKYWEAAVCHHPLGIEGVTRIDAIFEADRALADLAPVQRKARRDETVRPLVDAFFAWARAEYEKLPNRGLVVTALGYSVRQEQALRRFLEDGRFRMENNAAERALRSVALERRAWLFYGSDDHAGAAGNILSLVASCKLHDLDPEFYLAEVIRIVPYWPRNRFLERGVVAQMTGLAALTAVMHAVVVYGRGHFNVHLGHGVVVDIRRALFDHLQSLSLGFFTEARTGSVLSRILHDVHEATALIYTGVLVVALDAAQLALAIGLLLALSWKLTLACMALFPIYALVFWRMNPRVRRASERMHEQYCRISGNVAEQLAGQALIKTYVAEQRESKRFADELRRHHGLVTAQSHVGHLVTGASEVLVHFGTTTVVGFGGWLALGGELTAGEMTRFLGYMLIMFGPVRRFAELNITYQTSLSAMRRVFRVFDVKPTIVEPKRPLRRTTPRGHVRLEHVRFRYDERSREAGARLEEGDGIEATSERSGWVLDDVSLEGA